MSIPVRWPSRTGSRYSIRVRRKATFFRPCSSAYFAPFHRRAPLILSPEKEDICHNFEIEGGIWNFNNMNQLPNPIYTRDFKGGDYLGHVMFFYNVKNFRISNLTVKDPANYAVMIDTGSYFTIENIVFDFNFGNPIASNMDGIHLDGNCHYGVYAYRLCEPLADGYHAVQE